MRQVFTMSIALTALIGCQTNIKTDVQDESTQKVMEAYQTVSPNTKGQFTVFDGTNSRVVESSQATVSQTGEILTRVLIPASYKTLPNGQRVLDPNSDANHPHSMGGEANFVFETIPGETETKTRIEKVSDHSTELIVLPPQYETVTETVVVQPQSVHYETTPAEFGWVDGEIPGSTTEFLTTPPVYETVVEPVVVQEASTELVTVPAQYTEYEGKRVLISPARTMERTVPSVTKMESRRVVKTPAATRERVVPNIIKDGKTYMPIKPAEITEKTIPAVTKQVTRRVIKTPASTIEKTIDEPLYRKITEVVSKTPDEYVVRDQDGQIVKRFANLDEFAKFKNNPYKRVSDSPVSTFSSDVDTASYSFTRQFVKRGQKPPKDSIRVEEMVNYFDYEYDLPENEEVPFKPSITIVPSPWNAETRLVHIGVQGFNASAQSPETRPDMNLVFLIDVSGSMNRPNKLPLLKKSFEPLIKQLGPDDKVSIVTYAGHAGVALEPTSGRDKQTIRDAINQLGASGSTAGAAGIQTAYALAAKNFDAEGTNRVILATDGDFNVGLSDIEALKSFISDKRDSGIYLSVLGFGRGNLKDHLMQALAQNGNGIAGYIDSLKEARKFYTQDMAKNMLPIANDLKLQVEFNPERISEYRLLGYETRALKREDFNNDKVDAGDVGQGHAVTAIYEVNPKGSSRAFVDPLRYGKEAMETDLNFVNEFGFLKIRYKKPGDATSKLITAPITDTSRFDALDIAPRSTRFAVAVAAYGLKLRGDNFMDGMSWDAVTDLALGSKGLDPYGHRAEFVDLTRSAKIMEN